MWATGRESARDITRIMFFSPLGQANLPNPEPGDSEAAIVYQWLVSDAGYDPSWIHVYADDEVSIMGVGAYAGYDLVIYWSTQGFSSVDVVASQVPFVTCASGQTDEMGIGTGNSISNQSQTLFHIVDIHYGPTYGYPKGPLEFNSTVAADATKAQNNGIVLVAATVQTNLSLVQMNLVQNIMVLSNGDAEMLLTLTIPDSPLADGYREAFFTELPPKKPGQEYEIPEYKTVNATVKLGEGISRTFASDLNNDGVADIFDLVIVAVAFGSSQGTQLWDLRADTNHDGLVDIFDIVAIALDFGKTLPDLPLSDDTNRQNFYQGIKEEQEALLGFNCTPTHSTIIPWTASDEAVITVSADLPGLAEKVDTTTWNISVAHSDEPNSTIRAEAIGSFTMMKMQYLNQMLRGLLGDQNCSITWDVQIQLPAGANLLNGGEFNGAEWGVDLGGGSTVEAGATAPGTGMVLLHETVHVTEQEASVDEQYLGQVFGNYKVFNISYSLAGGLKSVNPQGIREGPRIQWVYERTQRISPGTYGTNPPWSWGLSSATIKVTPVLDVTWHVSWNWEWVGPWYNRKYVLTEFKAYFSVTPSIRAEVTTNLVAGVEKTFEASILEWDKDFNFFIGPIWVKTNLVLEVTVGLSISAIGAAINVKAATTASAYFKAGVQYERGDGWSTILETSLGATREGPTVTGAAVGVSIKPSLDCSLSWLFYWAAGPFIQVSPYANIYISPSRAWTIELRLAISAGTCTSDFMKKFIGGLGSYSRTLTDFRLAYWSG
jgi:hypothetical protein